jgi:acyl-coenzyme A thioesterase PaaI-like protein
MNFETIIHKARYSRFYLWLLNVFLYRMIPFNKPHGFRITQITGDSVTVLLPYTKSNFNHIKGLHACALATVSEYATGFLLITRLNPKQYRIIMQRLEMEYHYQGKTDATAQFTISDEWIRAHIYTPLASADAVVVPCEITIRDTNNNLLTTGKIYWQIKEWRKVKTQVKEGIAAV